MAYNLSQILSVVLVLCLSNLACLAQASTKFDPTLFDQNQDGQLKAHTVLVTVREQNATRLTLKNSLYNINPRFKSREERSEHITRFTQSLQKLQQESQKDLVHYLDALRYGQGSRAASIKIQPLWITNKIIVRGADEHFIRNIALHPDAQFIAPDKLHKLNPIEPEPVVGVAPVEGECPPKKGEHTYGLRALGAIDVWENCNNTGEGVVVGMIDSGVRLTHETVRDNFVGGKNGWFDPDFGTDSPNDNNGHGSHTVGTVVGANGVGVAPGAKWLACRACGKDYPGSCYTSGTLLCGQFVVCPTDSEGNNPDCSLTPHLVSNSWGDPNPCGEYYFDDAIRAWRTAGIIPVFSNGNDGASGCGSTGYPAAHYDVIGVGALTEVNTAAFFSSLGPVRDSAIVDGKCYTVGQRVKPDISASGVDICSASPSSDTSYWTLSGTSMSGPHVAGAVALIISDYLGQNVSYSYNDVYEALRRGRYEVNSSGRTCGETDDSTYPNNFSGWGGLNVAKSLQCQSKRF